MNPVYDVVVIGGAMAGAATATLLLRERPELRVLIVEKSTAFGRRVGEATVEVSAYFLGRQLGLTQHLNQAHLVKQGLRFWFFNSESHSMEECSEIGGKYLARVPSYQIDRAVLDEEILKRAAASAEVWRPARVCEVKLSSGGNQTLVIDHQNQRHEIQTRWIVDASGVAAFLARQNGWWRPNAEHPTTSLWARWKGVKDWDSMELAQKYPMLSASFRGIRGTATNHLMGDGWWAWWIPLKGGDFSIGVVFDQRLVQWSNSGTPGNQLKEFLCKHPVGAELLADAQPIEGDIHVRKNLSYSSTTFAADGFVLVGDAAGFIDPFYSPGMDWIAYTTNRAVQLIMEERRGASLLQLLAQHNRDFAVCYQRWFRALYLDKYEHMGDFELMRIAFLLDIALYYLGVASQPFRMGARAFLNPVFTQSRSVPFFHFMRIYNRRLACIARGRRARGVLGRRNTGRQFLFNGFSFGSGMVLPIFKAVVNWLWLELTEGWRIRRPRKSGNQCPVPALAAGSEVQPGA